ncbi:YybH family protein [Fictibacillus sp. BK138]|uniref:YybH family protein n=1 Tax=Fictibacillus sp. BK138 TaxID=2512121 RepID=UPI00102A9DC8|nr:nuclear transport factor 2 family protein [Fictibacillus sp. BK138]RZT15488.1 ketosteroid isomerase-like protein [Fictibacillus sp. BK138]
MTNFETLSQYIDATNSHLFTNVQSFIHDNAVFLFQEKCYKGIQEIRDYFDNTWSLIKDEDYRIDNIQWLSILDESALCIYNYHWSGFYKGEKVSGSGKATNAFLKTDGCWKIIHEHLTPLN